MNLLYSANPVVFNYYIRHVYAGIIMYHRNAVIQMLAYVTSHLLPHLKG